ncbi:MAG: hypothetical protein CMJ42_08095 [Phyllobacteriaceae bacterium]|nr:hypothetical protein [Phyllobacteriaceae bacterium]MBA89729.1 hypothetical protein [Phyllobacteriaceae bacterium]
MRKKKLEMAEAEGNLVRADKLADAVELIGKETLATLQRLPNKADEFCEAVAREGVSGLRAVLRGEVLAIATALADRLSEIAANAPREDPSLFDGQD